MSTSLAPGMASTSISFDGSTAWKMNTTFEPAGAWSLSIWLQTSAIGTNVQPMGGGEPTPGRLTYINVTTTGVVQWNVYTGGGGNEYHVESTSTVPVNDGIPHHVVITSANTTVANVKIYIDGVDRTGTNSGATLVVPIIDTVGAQPYTVANRWVGALQDVAGFNKELSAAEVLGLYQRSKGYLEESSADRVTRLLDDAGWPALWRDITTTSRATVGELVYDSATVNSKLQDMQITEQGRIFASKANYITFLGRYYQQEVAAGNTVQQIFSDDGGATALPYSTFGFDWHEVDVTNDVTVTTPTTWASASDAASITANDRQSKTVDTLLTTFADADAMARGLVAQYKDPTWRVAPILVYPERNTTRWDEVLGLELGYRAGIEITPMAVGVQNVQEVTIEQIEWMIEASLWSFVMTGSPCRDVWFIVDDADSLVDGTKVIGY